MTRFGDYELLELIVVHDTASAWIARAPSGALVDLVIVEHMRDDVDEAFFRGDVVPRWRAFAALGDARLPRMLGAPLRVDGRSGAAFSHTPSVLVEKLVHRAAELGGVALPLACALGRDIAAALATLHATGLALGHVDDSALVAGVDGTFRVVTALAGIPGHWIPEDISPAADMFGLGQALAMLSHVVDRADLPQSWRSFVRATHARPAERPTAAEALALFDRELAWTAWTSAQVADELRALLPNEVEHARLLV